MAEEIVMNTFEDICVPELTMEHLLKAAKFVSPCPKEEHLGVALMKICIDEYGITASDGCHLVQFPFETEVHQLSHADRLMLPVNRSEWKWLAEKGKHEDIGACIRRDDMKGWMLHAGNGDFEVDIPLQGGYPDYHRVVPESFRGQPVEMTEQDRRRLVKWMSSLKGSDIEVTIQMDGRFVWFTERSDYEWETKDAKGVGWIGLEHEVFNFQPVHFAARKILPMFKMLKHTKMEWDINLAPFRFSGGDGWSLLMPCR